MLEQVSPSFFTVMPLKKLTNTPCLEQRCCPSPPFPYHPNSLVVAHLLGTLTRSPSPFPYFLMLAFEAGSLFRALLLLLCSPLLSFLHHFLASPSLALRLYIFISFVGLPASSIQIVSLAVLSKIFLDDLHPSSYEVFISCGKRRVVTSLPRIMVEPFLKEYLDVEQVIGAEVHTFRGYCTGLLAGGRVNTQQDAVKKALNGQRPDVGLSNRYAHDHTFLSLCKESYLVSPRHVEPVPRQQYLKPLIFHDGRLAIRPTQFATLFVFLWWPIGVVLALMRLQIGLLLPQEVASPLLALCGLRIRIRGSPPLESASKGILYVCSHRTLMDPIMLSIALRKKLTAVTYSLSRLSEFISPISTVRLNRCRKHDAEVMQHVLSKGDLVVCPEGTTCREPYLLRFSPLFAELTSDIVPVTVGITEDYFHGTTARGFKGLDCIYFLMNPRPYYSVTILDPLSKEMTCANGKSSVEVANYVQKVMAVVTGYECTNLTRKDKYKVLVGNDGVVRSRGRKKEELGVLQAQHKNTL